ncbi:hypothetical protein [Sphingobium algorifonticola]|uniref:hypothetical protein n=1 Tax=Sphingobium algorifonticola TaxID=2008318 RepID=UPI0013E29891|nr:hypothetical protein [Sphingobium algorifonticola]
MLKQVQHDKVVVMQEQEDTQLLRALIEEGRASGVLDIEPEEIIEQILIQLPASDHP